MKKNMKTAYVRGNGVLWVNGVDEIIVLSPKKNEYWVLLGFEADIWNWMNLGRSISKIEEFIALYMGSPQEYAARIVRSVFNKWLTDGLIELVEIEDVQFTSNN